MVQALDAVGFLIDADYGLEGMEYHNE